MSQCNNMYIFPGLGLGASLAGASVVSDRMIHAAAVACSNCVSAEQIERGQVLAYGMCASLISFRICVWHVFAFCVWRVLFDVAIV